MFLLNDLPVFNDELSNKTILFALFVVYSVNLGTILTKSATFDCRTDADAACMSLRHMKNKSNMRYLDDLALILIIFYLFFVFSLRSTIFYILRDLN